MAAMDASRKALGKFELGGSSASSSSPLDLNVGVGAAESAVVPSDSSLVLATRASRQGVSFGTCSKLCAICFVAGVFFGYTLRRRVKRWASKFLRQLKDD